MSRRPPKKDPGALAIGAEVLPELTDEQVSQIYRRREGIIGEVQDVVAGWPQKGEAMHGYPRAVQVERVHALLSEWRLIAELLYGDDVTFRSYVATGAPELDPDRVLRAIYELFPHEEIGTSASVRREQVDRAIEWLRQ